VATPGKNPSDAHGLNTQLPAKEFLNPHLHQVQSAPALQQVQPASAHKAMQVPAPQMRVPTTCPMQDSNSHQIMVLNNGLSVGKHAPQLEPLARTILFQKNVKSFCLSIVFHLAVLVLKSFVASSHAIMEIITYTGVLKKVMILMN